MSVTEPEGDQYDPKRYFGYFLYQIHNCRRLEHLATLGLDLHRRSVLEVGAGVGDLTSFFINRDCTVTSLEGREASVDVLRQRLPSVAAITGDIEGDPAPKLKLHEIVFCYGLLYHLVDPAKAIARCAAAATRMMIVETCVTMDREPSLREVPEEALNPTSGLHGRSQWASRAWIVAELKRYFPHVYLPRTQPNHPEFPVDWTRPSESPRTRAVFVAAHAPLRNANLTDDIPDRQMRCA